MIVLPEGDSVSANWLATFAELRTEQPNSVLRVGVELPETSTNDPEIIDFNFFPIGIGMLASAAAFAVPTGVFYHLGLQFDEKLAFSEEFDVIARAKILAGIHASHKIVVVETKFAEETKADSGKLDRKSVVDQILAKLDRNPLLLPVGSISQIQKILKDGDDSFGPQRTSYQIRPRCLVCAVNLEKRMALGRKPVQII